MKIEQITQNAKLGEATDFRKGDTVHEVGSKLKGTVLHKGNRDEVVVKFGSINKSIPASQLRLVDELSEGPLVLSNDSSLLRMLDTLLSDWKSKQHSDDEMAALLKALGYSMDKKGDRTVLVKENELEEAPGAIRKGLAAVALIAGLWGVNNQMAQQAYDASPQLQKLTAYLEVAQEHNDQRMIKQLEQRIENHKTRLDIGKGEVMGKDGMPADVVYDKQVGEDKQRLDPKCWKGYKKQGTKIKGGVRVNNCVPK